MPNRPVSTKSDHPHAYSYHWLVSITDPLGHTAATIGYNPQTGQVQTVTDAMGKTLTYSYGTGSYAGEIWVYDQNGKTWTYYFDAHDRITDEVDPTGVRTSWSYDAANDIVSVATAGGGQTAGQQVATYDARGNRLTLTDAWNYTTTNTYDSQNDLLTSTDPLGHETSNVYDAHGNLTSSTNPAGTTTYTVNGQGLVTAVQDANGHTSHASYDASGNKSSSSDALGNPTSYTYDGVGRVLTATDPLGHTTTTTYDPAGNVLTVTDPLSHTTTTVYNADGEKTSVTDANTHTTTYAYDARGSLTTVTDALAGVTTYGYDAAGNRTSVTDANGHTTSYTFDAAGRALTVTDPLGRTQSRITYDALGRPVTSVDARGVTSTSTFSRRGELLGASYSDGTPAVSYTLDADGNRTAMSDGTGTTLYSYDAANRPTQVVNGAGQVVRSSYDAAGNETALTYPSGQTVQYGYDTDERLQTVTDWNSQTTSYAYDAASRLQTTTLPASTGVVTSYSYDTANHLLSVVDTKGGSTLYSASYTVDPAGNRTSKQDPSGTESYTLDALNRLTQATYPSGVTQSYSDDAVGNRTQLAVSGGSNPGTTTFTYDAADQISGMTGLGAQSYAYDQAGDTTARGSDSFTWNGAGELIGGTIGGQSFSAQYNGDGLRTSRTLGSTTTSFVLSGGNVIDDGTQYVYGKALLEHITPSGTFWYLDDGGGSTSLLVDSTGTVAQSYQYDVYGNVTASSGSQATEYQYTGQQTDATGLQYLRARYYDPTSGRFLSRDVYALSDPVTFPGYTYANANPVNANDPSGRAACVLPPIGSPLEEESGNCGHPGGFGGLPVGGGISVLIAGATIAVGTSIIIDQTSYTVTNIETNPDYYTLNASHSPPSYTDPATGDKYIGGSSDEAMRHMGDVIGLTGQIGPDGLPIDRVRAGEIVGDVIEELKDDVPGNGVQNNPDVMLNVEEDSPDYGELIIWQQQGKGGRLTGTSVGNLIEILKEMGFLPRN